MPYLRVTCPTTDAGRRVEVARALTDAVVALFTLARGPVTAADIRARTTVPLACYGEAELFVGGEAQGGRSRT